MQSESINRRNFMKTAALSTGAIFSGAPLLASARDARHTFNAIGQNSRILFQGDSITDAGRDRTSPGPNTANSLGRGYALLASAALLQKFPAKNLQCFNRGISGNKVFQLAERWEDDCLDLEPDILSILIGVNDFWHMMKHGYEGTIETYQNDFTALLERTKSALPDVKLIIGEPFALNEGTAIDDDWFPAFGEYQQAAKTIADNFDAVFIPYQHLFEEASGQVNATYWSADGVHPSLAGSELMAQAWIDALAKLS
jgi:lysophospholipase L1-like esterase